MSPIQLIQKYQKFAIYSILCVAIIASIAFFDKALAVGLFMLVLFTLITVLIISKIGIRENFFYLLFLVVILIHLAAVLFIYHYNFYPFGGGEGDQFYYHNTAVELSERFRHGNFSIEGFDKSYPYYYVPHFYPVIIGILYTITLPQRIIGQLLNVWIVALSILFLYLIVIEINGSKKTAFLVGLIASIYPSYLYFGSLLIRDAIVVLFSLLSLLLIIKLIKKFSKRNLFIFFLSLGLLIHFRFYVGFIMLLTFIVSWLLFFPIGLKKKFTYGAIIFLFLAFLPQLFAGQGLFGINSFKKFINPETITFFRERETKPDSINPVSNTDYGSTIVVKTEFANPVLFVENSLESFIYVSFGPFPWQIRYQRQLFALLEVIAWYVLLFFISRGIFKSYKKYKLIFPLIFFAVILFAVASVFIDNFGTYMRIRIPGFLALLALADFNLRNNIFILNFLKRVNKFRN